MARNDSRLPERSPFAQRLITLLRVAAESLDAAIDLVDEAEEGDLDEQSKGYLLARLDTACQIVESELPEFKAAAMVEALRSMMLPGDDSFHDDVDESQR